MVDRWESTVVMYVTARTAVASSRSREIVVCFTAVA
jgi:hypothetical protein